MGIFDAALLAAAITLSTPILLAAVGELVAQRAGMINIGLEGMMLTGALASFIVADFTGSVIAALTAGAVAGLTLTALVALLTIEAKADQIVVGIGLNIFALGLTRYFYQDMYSQGEQTVVDRMGSWPLPILSEIPFIGPAFFNHSPLVYLAFLSVPLVGLLLSRSNWGIAIRATGELPEAVDAAGLSVRRVRWMASIPVGLLAGLGGAFLVVGHTGLFQDDMSAGRGFLAFAAVVFGRWFAGGVLGASLVFGGADALQLRLQNYESVPSEVWWLLALITAAFLGRRFVRGPARASWRASSMLAFVAALLAYLALSEPPVNLPSQLWLATPYVLVLVALGGMTSKSRMPAVLGQPYKRDN